MAQDRDTFQRLADLRLMEAKLLLENGQASGAYHLAGYAVECALKAKIAADFRANENPELKRVQNIYTHDLSALLGLANLREQLESEREANPGLYQRWTMIKDWSEKARYVISTEDNASAILEAIGGDEGILQWLRNRW